MRFNKHSELEGKHAFLSPSSYHWIRYDDAKLVERYANLAAKERGTRLHMLAADCIFNGVKLQGRKTLASYVNDAISYKMTVEQPLYYSEFCFGTVDAISFRKNFLRIHDLKTGETPASMDQLMIYAALFCLEYHIKPGSIDIELRIYQNNEVSVCNPTAVDILPLMDRIVHADRVLRDLESE